MKKESTSVFSAQVAEAEYQIKRRDTIGFYDCLRPRLKARVKRNGTKDEICSNIDDLAELVQENVDLSAQSSKQKDEINKLEKKVQMLENE